jgi:hypothetical protein
VEKNSRTKATRIKYSSEYGLSWPTRAEAESPAARFELAVALLKYHAAAARTQESKQRFSKAITSLPPAPRTTRAAAASTKAMDISPAK